MRWGIVTCALLAACAPSIPPPPPGIPGASAPDVRLSADPALASPGELEWTQNLPLPISSTRVVNALGDVWLLAGTAPDDQNRISQVVGSSADGAVLSQVSYDRAVGFPVTDDGRSVGVRSTSTATRFVVRGWKTTTGRTVWRTPVSAQGPRASVRVAGLVGRAVLVRPTIADQGVFQLSSLIALDRDDGRLLWRLRSDRGLRSVTPGPLVTVAYRTDEQRDGPVTRVAFVRPSDGSIQAEVDWQDYRNHFRPAAVAITRNRVLLRGDRDNAGDIHVAVVRADGSQLWHSAAAAEPAVDFESRTIAIARRNGSVETRHLLSGKLMWRWTPAEVLATRAELGRGAFGVFWGNSGPDNVVVAAHSGVPLFVGQLSPVDPSRWNGEVLVIDSETQVSGYSGQGAPIGFPQTGVTSKPLFVEAP